MKFKKEAEQFWNKQDKSILATDYHVTVETCKKLMSEFAKEQVKLFAIPNVSDTVCGHSAQFLHSHGDQIYCSECGKYYDYPQTGR